MYRHATKFLFTFAATAAVWLLSSPAVFAADAIPAGDPLIKVIFSVGAMIGAGLAIGLGVHRCGCGHRVMQQRALPSAWAGFQPPGQDHDDHVWSVWQWPNPSQSTRWFHLILIFANPYKTFLFG